MSRNAYIFYHPSALSVQEFKTDDKICRKFVYLRPLTETLAENLFRIPVSPVDVLTVFRTKLSSEC